MSFINKKVKKKYAQKIAEERLKKRVMGIMVLTIASLFMLIFGIAAYQENNGNFTINLNLYDRRKGLALSADAAFSYPTSKLYADRIELADNISGSVIPQNVDETDGSHNGQNYVAYTFYLKNAGQQAFNYQVNLNIVARAKGMEKATWVMLYEDSITNGYIGNQRVRTVYALSREDGTMETGENDPLIKPTASFLNNDIVFSKVRNIFSPGEVHKYTVVVWLEGDDPDCRLEISGGMIRLEMNFAVLS